MITENVAQIRSRIAAAARAAGRDPADIRLCAATKMNDSAAVREAIAAGVDCCGENRVQELVKKLDEHAYDGAPVHFIGALQRNKVRQVVGQVDVIESVDRRELLADINAEAAKRGIVQDILLEINAGGEKQKSGFLLKEFPRIVEEMADYPAVRVRGLMTVPPIGRKKGDNCRYFQKIRRIAVDITAQKYDNIFMDFLSMGMTDDFEDAIACGSTMVRIGTAIFGTLYKIVGNKAEALEFRATEKSAVCGRPLMELPTRPNLLIGAINREGRIITPGGRDTIEPGDTVVVVTAATGLNDLDDILDKRRVKA